MKKKQKNNPIKFTCPICGCNAINEVVKDIVMKAQLKAVSSTGKDLEYRYLNLSDGIVSHYECAECGRTIKDEKGKKIKTQAEFVKWLKRQKEIN